MISTRIYNFNPPFSGLNSIKSLDIGRLNLAWGSVSLGNTGWRDFFQGIRPNIWGIFSLVTEILSYTEETSEGYLQTSNRYKQLVDTDLQSATHRLGAAVAKCMASKTIGVHWLQHAKPLIDDGIIMLIPGTNRRPDYVGLDKSGWWHSIEAKGRSNAPGRLIEDAKQQARLVTSINGRPPVTFCGCVSHLYESPIHVEFCDPSSNEEKNENIKLIIDTDKYMHKYYAPFIDLVYENAEFISLEIETNLGLIEYMIPRYPRPAEDMSTNIRYGIFRGIYELIRIEQLSLNNVVETFEYLVDIKPKAETSYLGPDGILLSIERISSG